MSKNLTASLSLRIRTFGTESVKGLKEGLQGVDKAAKGVKTSWDELGKAMQGSAGLNQASELFGKVSSGIQRALQGPIDKFAEFELTMGRARGKMDEISNDQFETLKRKALELGTTTAFSATQVAAAMGEMAAGGFTVEEQLKAIDSVTGLATAGEVDLARATKIAANTMNQFGLHAADTAEISNVLVAASNASTIGLEEIAASLTYVGPIARGANISLQSTASFIGLLGNAGIEASMAGTTLNAMIARLATQSPKARKQLAHLGIGAKQMKAGVSDPVSALMLLNEQFDKKHYTAAQRMATVMEIFGQESAKGVIALMSTGSALKDGKTGFERMQDAVTNSGSAIANYNKNIEETTAVKMKRFQAQIDSLEISIGSKLAPAFLGLLEAVKPMVDKFAEFVEKHPEAIKNIAEAAVVVGGLAVAFQGVSIALGTANTAWAAAKFLGAGAAAPIRAALAASGAGAAASAGTAVAAGAGGTAAASAGAAAAAPALIAKLAPAMAAAAKAATIAGGVAMAGALGYALGTAMDYGIGKLTGARGGKLSTEAALSAGESDTANSVLGTIGKVPGLGFLAEAAAGNRKRNADEQSAKANGHAPGAIGQGQFNAVTGKIEVMITDQRPKVRTEAQGPLALRVGTSSAGRQ